MKCLTLTSHSIHRPNKSYFSRHRMMYVYKIQIWGRVDLNAIICGILKAW